MPNSAEKDKYDTSLTLLQPLEIIFMKNNLKYYEKYFKTGLIIVQCLMKQVESK